MKLFPCVLLLAASASFLMAQSIAPKSDTPSGSAAVGDILPNQQAFLNLSEEQRKKFVSHFREANRMFSQKRIFETLEELRLADKVFDESPEVHNLRGSCYVEIRAFDKALASFQKAQTFGTKTNSIAFNTGEVYFVTKQWQQAVETFEALIKVLPEDDIYLSRLAQFKVLLCKIKLGNMDEARILAEKYDYMDDSPYYYYAKAALAYEQENMMEAEEWLARARRIFRDPNIIAPWQDTLVEFGYIKSFYGGDDGEN